MGLFKVVVVVLLVTSPCWSKAPPGYVKKPDHDKDPPKYEYSYDVKDGVGGVQGHVETRDGEFAHGVYYVAIPHGGQSVQYFADDWGYHPLVSYASNSPHGSSRAQLAFGEKAVAALYKSTGGLIQELKSSPAVAPAVLTKTGPRIIQAVQLAAPSPALVVPVAIPPQPLALVGGAVNTFQSVQGLAGASQAAGAGYQQSGYVTPVSYTTARPSASYASVQQGRAAAIANDLAYQQVSAHLAGVGEDKLEITSFLADANAALPFGARTSGKNVVSSVQLTQGGSVLDNQEHFAVTQSPVPSGYTSLKPIVVAELGRSQEVVDSVTVSPALLSQTASSTHVESSSASSSYVSTAAGGTALTTALGAGYSTEKPILFSTAASYSPVTPSPTVIVTPPAKNLALKLHSGYSQQPIVVPESLHRVPQVLDESSGVKLSTGGHVLLEEKISHVQSNVNGHQDSLVLTGGVDNRLQQKAFYENFPLNTYAAEYNQQFFDAAREVNLGQYIQGNPLCDPQVIHVEKQVPVPVEVEKPIVIEKTRIVEVEKPVPVESTKIVEIEKPIHFESTKFVAVDRPVPVAQPVPVEVTKLVPVDRPFPYPQPYAVAQPYPYPYPVPQAVPHLVPYPQVVPVPYKEYQPIYLQGKQAAKSFNSYRKDSSYSGSFKSGVVYADQFPALLGPPSDYRSGKNRNVNLSRHRPHPKKLCIEYGGFKPPMVPSEQIDEYPEYPESD